MNGEARSSDEHDIIRNELKEHRGDWFVEYHCATKLLPCAILNVVFMKRSNDSAFVRKTMTEELELWLQRYPVPVMVYGIDEKERTIRFHEDDGNHMLTGYTDVKTKRLVSRWGLMRDADLPAEQLSPDYWQHIYADVPFRRRSELKTEVDQKYRNLNRGTFVILFFIVVVPVLIELIALGVTWLGYALSAISIGAGLFKIAKTFGWLKPSAGDEKKAEEQLQMKHHHYHCVRNPNGFARLRAENFARETEEKLRQESEQLALAAATQSPKSRNH